jgi:Glycogen recognition site of AMP-activated protein kinase
MNSQTITTRANAKHFGQASSPKTKTQPSNEPGQKINDGHNSEGSNNSATSPQPDESLYPSSHVAQETSFRLEAPAAAEVLLVGEFTEWEKAPIKLIKGGGGSWHTKVALPRGRHLYRFLMDGKWQDDPHRPGREPNNFGTTNCFVEVV